MRRQDFIESKMEGIKFRVSFPEEVITTQELIDEFAIGFAAWIRKEVYYEHLTKEFIYKRNVYESEKELLEVFKKEKGL